MLPATRRWFMRHPARWVLGLVLGLTLGGAQLVAACHEISHTLVHERADAGTLAVTGDPVVTAATALAPVDGKSPPAAVNGHECPICLIAAALGGVATAPHGPVLPAADGLAAAPLAVERSFVPRFAPAYASRAPPVAPAAA
jgi:hypothetical protein